MKYGWEPFYQLPKIMCEINPANKDYFFFREMKKRGFKVGRETKIVFGGNYRWRQIICFAFFYAILPISGVIAASVWGGLWPEMQQNIVVGSSLYDASTKVRQPLKIPPPILYDQI